jgi:hypothetical protein
LDEQVKGGRHICLLENGIPTNIKHRVNSSGSKQGPAVGYSECSNEISFINSEEFLDEMYDFQLPQDCCTELVALLYDSVETV